MARLVLFACMVLAALTGCKADPPRPFAMPVEPLLGTFTVFERLDTGFIESRRYSGAVTIEQIAGDDTGYRVSSEEDVVFRFDPRTGRLSPDLIDNDPSTPPFSTIVEIHAGSAGMSRPPAPYFAPVPIHPQGVVLLSQSFLQLYLVRGSGPAYWADVPTNLPQGVDRIEDWEGNRWGYKLTTKRAGSRSELVIGELTLRGEPVKGRAGQAVYTPIGKFVSHGDSLRPFGRQGWMKVEP